MKLKYIDYPVNISKTKYEELKTKLVEKLIQEKSILSVYQMGSINHPGISDLDIICVFKNKSQCFKDFRYDLTSDEKNILTHSMFGIEERYIVKSMSYNLISNLKFLGGKDLILYKKEIEISSELKQQIALEYLVKMLITIDSQVTLRIVKLRAFLLLAKAIAFDLELLDIKSGRLYDLVGQVIQYRENWFIKKPCRKEITDLVLNFNKELRLFLKTKLLESKLYLPVEKLELPGKFTILKDSTFSINHKGLVLPNHFSFLGKKYINLQYRLNSFIYKFPFNISKIDSLYDQRFEFSKNLVKTNKKKYPSFIPLTTSLSIY